MSTRRGGHGKSKREYARETIEMLDSVEERAVGCSYAFQSHEVKAIARLLIPDFDPSGMHSDDVRHEIAQRYVPDYDGYFEPDEPGRNKSFRTKEVIKIHQAVTEAKEYDESHA